MAKNNTRYVDGFVIVVPKKKVEAYKKMAQEGAKIWMKYGALDYKECMGDDLTPNMGPTPALRFPKMTNAGKADTVWFSYITYKSRVHRDSVNKKVMSEMHKMYKDKKDIPEMPFDMKQMAFGGFTVMVSGK